MLRMPPVCAVTGEPADTAIIVCVGDADLILPVCDRVRSEHLRPLGALRTAWRLRPSMRDGVITLHNAAGPFVDQVLGINEPGTVYVGGLYPLKTTSPDIGSTTLVADEAA